MAGTRIAGALVVVALVVGCSEEKRSVEDPWQALPVLHLPWFAYEPEGESILFPLVDREFEDKTGQLGEGPLRLGAVLYGNHPRTAHNWILFDPGAKDQLDLMLPVTSKGDVADLYYRITGKKHPTLKGELSAAYKAFLKLP